MDAAIFERLAKLEARVKEIEARVGLAVPSDDKPSCSDTWEIGHGLLAFEHTILVSDIEAGPCILNIYLEDGEIRAELAHDAP